MPPTRSHASYRLAFTVKPAMLVLGFRLVRKMRSLARPLDSHTRSRNFNGSAASIVVQYAQKPPELVSCECVCSNIVVECGFLRSLFQTQGFWDCHSLPPESINRPQSRSQIEQGSKQARISPLLEYACRASGVVCADRLTFDARPVTIKQTPKRDILAGFEIAVRPARDQ